MNVTAFKEAQAAYTRGDYVKALEGFEICSNDVGDLSPADLSKFYHLIGNCYIKNNQPEKAAEFYRHALDTSPRSRRPTLFVNLGTALLNNGEYDSALRAFNEALSYESYATPYRAKSGIGAAQLKLGNMTEAGAAYRDAALDSTNPQPAKALVNLGVCFMELGRSGDAIISYETALDFDLDPIARSRAWANLGQAYMVEGRVQKAIDAFENAIADGLYELSPMANHDFEIAKKLNDRIGSKVPGIFNTGFIPKVVSTDDAAADAAAVQIENDPFAPKTGVIDKSSASLETDSEQSAQVAQPAMHAADSANFPGKTQGESKLETGEDPWGFAEKEDEGKEEGEVKGEDEGKDGMEAETVAFAPVDNSSHADIDTGVTKAVKDSAHAADEPTDAELAAETSRAFAELDKEEDSLPSPDQTEFFDVSENDIVESAKNERKKARKRRGTGLKVAITIIVILIVIAAALAAAYFFGYGYPTQEAVAQNLFTAAQQGQSTDEYWADSVDETARISQLAAIEDVSSFEVDAVQRAATQSVVYMKTTVSEGAQVYYEVMMGRDGISWNVLYVELYFPSEG